MVDVGIFFPTHRDTDLFRHSLEYLNDFFLFVLLDFYENRILQRLDEYADVGETKKIVVDVFLTFIPPIAFGLLPRRRNLYHWDVLVVLLLVYYPPPGLIMHGRRGCFVTHEAFTSP